MIEGTADMLRYIELYLDCVINRDNVGMLFHIAAKVKSVKGLDPNGNPEEDNTVSLPRCKIRDITDDRICTSSPN